MVVSDNMGEGSAFDTQPTPVLSKTTVPGKQKALIVRRKNPQFALYGIFYDGGGETPDSLKGTFTSVERAQALIDAFIRA